MLAVGADLAHCAAAAQELDGSLARMRFDHVDVIYANPPPPGLELAALVSSVAGLISSGKARAWAIVNWPADLGQRHVGKAGVRELPHGRHELGPLAMHGRQDGLRLAR